MRANLLKMLDALGVPKLLHIEASAALFGGAAHLLHTGSAVRYPVFVESRNYTGSNPKPGKSPLLIHMVQELLVAELASVPHAAIVPLGRSGEEVLEGLFADGSVKYKRWLTGFPHPSGANGHRARQLEKNRVSIVRQLRKILG